MEFLALGLLAGAAIAVAVAQLLKNASDRSSLESEHSAKTRAQLYPHELLELGDEDSSGTGGTTKIDREALRAIVGGTQASVEQAFFVVIAGEGVGRLIKLEREEYIIGRESSQADIVFRDDAISQRHARVVLTNDGVELEDLGSSNGTFVDGKEVSRAMLTDGSRVVLGRSTVLTLTFQDELGEKFQKRMYESSTRDPLTGAINKATFLDQAHGEMRFAERHKTNFCLAVLDIDHFKSVNDSHGHLVGDAILSEVGERIRRATRDEALFARYGGEEFIVAERGASVKEGAIMAERIRRVIADTPFSTTAGDLTVTVSIGVADLESIEAPDIALLIESADRALYEAKRAGRNRVVLAS